MSELADVESPPAIGHNSGDLTIHIELRLFNRIRRLVGDGVMHRKLELAAGTTIGDVLQRFGIPSSEIFIAFVNGHDVSVSPGTLRLERSLDEGDVLALSGPIPYSWGYGAPVV